MNSDDELERYIGKEKRIWRFLNGCWDSAWVIIKTVRCETRRQNGNHAYIDGINEARKVLMNEFGSALFTIAKDKNCR